MPLPGAAASAMAAWQMTAVVWALAIGGWDLFRRRVPNVLIFAAIFLAAGNLALSGVSPLGADGVSVLAGVGLALVLTLPGYLTRKLGAGDVKLLVAIALLGGALPVLTSFVLGALATGAAAVAWLLLGPRFGLPPLVGKRLPFGTALALGFLAAVAAGHAGNLPWPR